MRRRNILILAILAVRVVGAFVARSKTATQENRLLKITYVETKLQRDGQVKIHGRRVRIVEVESGQYKETDYAPDGTERDSMLVSKQGVFVIRDKVIQVEDEFAPLKPSSKESFAKKAVGTDLIAGYTAYGSATNVRPAF